MTKDEEYYIDEWTDYHLAIGFSDILIYDNSITNDLAVRRNNVRIGDEKIELVHWPNDSQEIPIYKDCAKRAVEKNRSWVAFFTVHEFLVLRKHKDVVSLFEYCNVDVLSFNMYVFGAAFPSAEPLTRRCTLRKKKVEPHVKSVIRVSSPETLEKTILHIMTHPDTNHRTFSGPPSPNVPINVAVLHHYMQNCESLISSKPSCVENNDEKLFSVTDNSAWLELTGRVPLYSLFDAFYNESRHLVLPAYAYERTVSLCIIVKDEELYLDEWTDYHLSLGFADILIYDNSVENNLRRRKQNIIRPGDERIEIIHWTGSGQQLQAYTDCARRCQARNRTWAAFFDIDEFLVLRKHDDVVSLLEEHCHSGAVSLNWYIFGTSGLSAYSSEPVSRRFNMRAEHVIDGVKSVLKLADWKGFTNPHYPILLEGSQHDTNNHNFSGPANVGGPMDVASIYHFWSKSTKEFVWKGCLRGRSDEGIKSPFHKANCNGHDLNMSRFRQFDNTVWLELTKRVPLYSMYDEYYKRRWDRVEHN